jgi:hypothetical protein
MLCNISCLTWRVQGAAAKTEWREAHKQLLLRLVTEQSDELIAIGRCFRSFNRPLDAIKYFEAALESGGPNSATAMAERSKTAVMVAYQRVSRVPPSDSTAPQEDAQVRVHVTVSRAMSCRVVVTGDCAVSAGCFWACKCADGVTITPTHSVRCLGRGAQRRRRAARS